MAFHTARKKKRKKKKEREIKIQKRPIHFLLSHQHQTTNNIQYIPIQLGKKELKKRIKRWKKKDWYMLFLDYFLFYIKNRCSNILEFHLVFLSFSTSIALHHLFCDVVRVCFSLYNTERYTKSRVTTNSFGWWMTHIFNYVLKSEVLDQITYMTTVLNKNKKQQKQYLFLPLNCTLYDMYSTKCCNKLASLEISVSRSILALDDTRRPATPNHCQHVTLEA